MSKWPLKPVSSTSLSDLNNFHPQVNSYLWHDSYQTSSNTHKAATQSEGRFITSAQSASWDKTVDIHSFTQAVSLQGKSHVFQVIMWVIMWWRESAFQNAMPLKSVWTHCITWWIELHVLHMRNDHVKIDKSLVKYHMWK